MKWANAEGRLILSTEHEGLLCGWLYERCSITYPSTVFRVAFAVALTTSGCSLLTDFSSLSDNAGGKTPEATGGAGAVGGGGGHGDVTGTPCEDPGKQEDCYTDLPSTKAVGLCKGGRRTCSAEGVWTECEGQVVPTTETCATAGDDDCDGSALCAMVPSPGSTTVVATKIIALAHDVDSNRYALVERSDGKRYLEKFDLAGKVVGTRLLPGLVGVASGALALAVDKESSPGVVVGGCFAGNHDFGAGIQSTEESGESAVAFIVKYTGAALQYFSGDIYHGGEGSHACVTSLAVNDGGAVFWGGVQLAGAVTWEDQGAHSVKGIVVGRISPDFADLKLASPWATSDPSVKAVTLGESGVVVSGQFRDEVTFGATETLMGPSNGDLAGFIVRLNLADLGPNHSDLFPASALQAAPDGSILAAFAFDSVTLSGQLLQAQAGNDVAVVRLGPTTESPLGPLDWSVISGSAGTRVDPGLAIDSAGRVFVGGRFQQKLSFIGLPNEFEADGSTDAFIVGLSKELEAKTFLRLGADGAGVPELVLHALGSDDLLVGATFPVALDPGDGLAIGPGTFLLQYPGL